MAGLANRKINLLLAFVFCSSLAFAQSKNAAAPAPYGAVPSPAQVKWQQMEYYMFIHFGPNTFTDKEWGHGDEDPKVFNPTKLDARQWARTAKEAGMKAIIITAKHHDGFCLWPSKYSTHTVRESAWKEGKGDVLKELAAACKEYGLKLGMYLSPWDRNHPKYGTSEYNEIFAKTLDEVHTQYGEVFEQWFDGANGEGPNGKRQEYDWKLFNGTVFKHHPDAVIFSDIGPGCRWIGNENGYAGKTNWSTLNTAGFGVGNEAPKPAVLNQGNRNGEKWIPGEADVSIRPGWFYSPSTDDKGKSLLELSKIYNASVGRNANLLLNVPVDRRGLIHKNDSLRLMEFRKLIDESFKTNLALNRKVSVSQVRGGSKNFAASNLSDGNFETYWTTNDDMKTGSFVVDLGVPVEVNRIVLQEYIPLGQRVASFSVDVWDGSKFRQIDKQTTIGYKRILSFPSLMTSKVRVNILEADACPVISEVQIFKAPELLSSPVISRDKSGRVTILADNTDPVITYTVDGSEPTYSSKRYTDAFNFTSGGTIKAKTFINNGAKSSETIRTDFDIAPVKWSIVSADDEVKNFEAIKAIDGDIKSQWITNWNEAGKKYPHEIAVDMGEKLLLKGFSYTPRQDGNHTGIIYRYNFYISNDGQNWQKVVNDATFANIKNNPVKQEVKFDKPVQARFIKLDALAPAGEKEHWAAVAELSVITR
ncbi:alpha-L-fucosidase [Flavihumibacter sp. R14]|nr:alpha-L-fucosidase [Flavihumibacter soli]